MGSYLLVRETEKEQRETMVVGQEEEDMTQTSNGQSEEKRSEEATKIQQYIVEEDALAKIFKIRHMVYFGALLPGLGCYFCIAYTYLFQFERIETFNHTDCPNVHSLIPPVSYTIGVWEPQRFFWMFIMFLHMPPRLTFLVLYRRLFLGNAPKDTRYRRLLWFFLRTMWMEPMGLVAVSVIDINSNFVLHAIGYAVWIISFNFNMLFNVLLHHFSRLRKSNCTHELTWKIKVFMFVTGVTLSLSTAVTYPMFMVYCDSYAYVGFSIAEYLLVGYNSFFYFLAYWEFPKLKISMGLQQLHTLNKVRIVPREVMKPAISETKTVPV